MIVRKYGRRNRSFPTNFSDSLSQESSPDPLFGMAYDSEPYPTNSWQGSFSGSSSNKKFKKAKIEKRELEILECSRPEIPCTPSLMEAQEFGEMMEHVDEVNFALDGLRKNRHVRIRRASLMSLLSVSGTAQHRRLLRSHGMAKTIIDAILGLSFDDSASNLAAATLFYILTGDGQDDHLLESPSCVSFLIKLLKPILSMDGEVKAPRIGHKLLLLRTGSKSLQSTTERLDSSSLAIFSKVEEILLSCKEIKSRCIDTSTTDRPELCPKWIALRTIEKACLTTISLEETSGAIRKTGDDFKDKLRELGGLDAVFEVAKDFHSNMEDARYENFLQSLMLLLKCLKIMENATFPSKDNQSHLLGIKRNLEGRETPQSFIEIMLNVIKILSGLFLHKSSPSVLSSEKSAHLLDWSCTTSKVFAEEDGECKANRKITLSSCNSKLWCNAKCTTFNKSSIISQNMRNATARLDHSLTTSGTTSTLLANASFFKMRQRSSTSGSSTVTSRSTDSGSTTLNKEKTSLPDFTEGCELILSENQDPFSFDEGDFEPSKWELLSQKENKSRSKTRMVKFRDLENGCKSQMMMCEKKSLGGKISCTTPFNEEGFSLIADCLLSSIKVLMNLTNDNHIGCQQITSCGGLETVCSLIANHFPSFCSTSSILNDTLCIEFEPQNDKHLTDQELDFLVAILGLLVNLVEKDGHNRSRLASVSVSLPSVHGPQKGCSNVIPLICSIFLANQGASDGIEDGQSLPWSEEVALLEGEKEAEKMIIEAYSALLLALLSTESQGIREAILDCLPEHNLSILVPVLERFVAFHLTLNMISPETHTAVTEVIESCRHS